MKTCCCALFLAAALALQAPARAEGFELVVAFDPALGELPESVTLDAAGNLYLSMGNGIRKLTPSGELSVYATLPIQAFALGLKFGPDGCLYNASTSLDPAVVGTFVWRICAQGAVEQFAALDPNGAANDLAFDDAGYLYVTDPFLGQVWRIDPEGTASVWLSDPLLLGNPADPALVIRPFGVDGLAFDRNKQNLYLGNLDYGRILRVQLDCDGNPGALEVFVEDPRLEGADGIAFDKKGTLFVAVGAQDSVASVAEDGSIRILGEGGLLDGPSSIAFGTRGSDKHTMYVTSLALSRAFGLKPGVPHPALVKTRARHRGLPLP